MQALGGKSFSIVPSLEIGIGKKKTYNDQINELEKENEILKEMCSNLRGTLAYLRELVAKSRSIESPTPLVSLPLSPEEGTR